MAPLKSQASKGVIWTAAERFGQQLIQAVVFVILVLLLTREDFGLIAMLMIFFAVAQSFIDSGMGQALIRLKEITDDFRAHGFGYGDPSDLFTCEFCMGIDLFLIGSGLIYLFSNLLFKNKSSTLVFETMAPYLPSKINNALQP